MTRLAEGRETHLDRSEIAIETLRLFDEGHDPSIRQLAKVLAVTPSAIYHHFDSRAQIVQAAVELVWQEILTGLLEEVGDPFTADPVEFLTTTAFVTRRVFTRHYAIAPYLAAVPDSDELSANTLAIMANVFERMGLTGAEAAEAFHAYASFVFGNALFAANRLAANAELEVDTVEPGRLERYRAETGGPVTEQSSPETRTAIDSIMDISMTDPDRDLELFGTGLRRLLTSMTPA
jgi:AcrR family transcriptional regulator